MIFFFFKKKKNYTINLPNWNLIKNYYHEQILYVETLKIKTKFTQLELVFKPQFHIPPIYILKECNIHLFFK